MSTSAIVTMVFGMVAIWGGLAASIALTLRRSRASRVGPGSP
jgi:hypothetical protein